MAYEGFNKLKGQLAHQKGVTDPAALAAYIGRKKYGSARMQQAARKGKRIKNVPKPGASGTRHYS